MVEGIQIGSKEIDPVQEEDRADQASCNRLLRYSFSNIKKCYLQIIVELLRRLAGYDLFTITGSLQYQTANNLLV
jgi:hypothetical protein